MELRAEEVLFPNLSPQSQDSSVSVYSPERHFFILTQLTPRLVATTWPRRWPSTGQSWPPTPELPGRRSTPTTCSRRAVHLPLHFQGGVHPTPTNQQRLLAAVPGDRYADDLATERRLGRRWLGEIGGIEWLAAFAPLAPGDIRAFLPGGPSSPAELVMPRQLLVDGLQEVHC